MIPCATCGQLTCSTDSRGRARAYCSPRCRGTVNRASVIRRDYYAEEVEHLTSTGSRITDIPDRLGIKPGSLAKALDRHGRHDLSRMFWALDRAMKRAAS